MNYIDSTLTPGEQVLYAGRISMCSMTKGIVLSSFMSLMIPFYSSFWMNLPVGIFGLGLLIYFVAWCKKAELAITNKKIVAKYGVIGSDTVEIPIQKIESLQVRQSVWGKICGYGTVVVAGSGNPSVPIVGVSDPMAFRRAFTQVAEGWKE